MKRFWKIAGIVSLVAILGAAVAGAVVMAQDPEDAEAFPFNFRERLHEAIAGVLGIEVADYDAAVEQARERVLGEAVDEGWLTEEQAEWMQDRAQQGFGPGMRGGFRGSRGGAFGPGVHMGGPGSSLVSTAADALGLTVSELLDELEGGKSIADVAGERNVDVQEIADAHLAEHQEWLAQAVEDGRMTQEQADWMQSHMEEEVQERLTEPFSFGGRGSGGCWGQESGTYGPGRMAPGRMGPGWMIPGQMGPGRFDGTSSGTEL